MVIFILISLILAVAGSQLYYLGGQGGAWWKNTKMRDWGCNLCIIGIMIMSSITFHRHVPWWVFTITFLAQWYTLSTYHKWLNKYFHEPTTDVFWFNWIATGLCWGLAAGLVAWKLGSWHWITFGARVILLGWFTMYWSEKENNVWREDTGKSLVLVLSTIIL